MLNYETVIGLEIHCQLSTKSKMFCSCPNRFSTEPNSNCCPGCLAMPGMLPSLNKTAVEYAIRAGLALNCTIAEKTMHHRKSYFYPDLPNAFQITQFDTPLCVDGWLDITVDGEKRRIRIERIHIEEDTAKLTHLENDNISYLDINRGSLPLIEIVTKPDFRSAEETRIFLETLKTVLVYLNVTDGKMEEGSLRCDVNVSVRPKGQETLGERTEMKNVSSFKAAERAVEYESKRQIGIIEEGGKIYQETLQWNDEKNENSLMRSKESALDYRYFPEPNLPPLIIEKEWIEEIKNSLPELPSVRKERLMNDYNLPDFDAWQISESKPFAAFFEDCVSQGTNAKSVSNWLLSDISKYLNEKNLTHSNIPFTPNHLKDMINLIENGTISGAAGKTIITELFANPRDISSIVSEKNLAQISDTGALNEIIKNVIENNPQSVADYKAGKDRAIGFLVGQTMRASKGQANPQILNELIKTALDSM